MLSQFVFRRHSISTRRRLPAYQTLRRAPASISPPSADVTIAARHDRARADRASSSRCRRDTFSASSRAAARRQNGPDGGERRRRHRPGLLRSGGRSEDPGPELHARRRCRWPRRSHRAGAVHPGRAGGLAGKRTATCATGPAAALARREPDSFAAAAYGFQLSASGFAASVRVSAYAISVMHVQATGRGGGSPGARGGAQSPRVHDPHSTCWTTTSRRRVGAHRSAAYERDIAWLEACDILIADASGSSFAVGSRWATCSASPDRTGSARHPALSRRSPRIGSRAHRRQRASRDAASALTRQAPNSAAVVDDLPITDRPMIEVRCAVLAATTLN